MLRIMYSNAALFSDAKTLIESGETLKPRVFYMQKTKFFFRWFLVRRFHWLVVLGQKVPLVSGSLSAGAIG